MLFMFISTDVINKVLLQMETKKKPIQAMKEMIVRCVNEH